MAIRDEQAASREFLKFLRLHRATLDRFLDRRSVVALKKMYDRAQDELELKLARLVRAGRQETMTAMQAQQLLEQVREAQQIIAGKAAEHMVPISREVQAEGVRQSAATLIQLEAKFTGATMALPIEEAATFARVVEARTASLIRMHSTSWERYGARVTEQIEDSLALSLSTGDTPLEAIERIRAVTDQEWWQGERIVRTELAYSYNSAHADAIEESAKELKGLYKRWCEHVDDATGRPLDDRVANDSLAMHGQIVANDGLFVMIPDNRVSAKLWGKTWRSGPNRPNDRSVTMPWRAHWGIPGWQAVNGQRVPADVQRRTFEELTKEANALLSE